ncbi:Ca-transporting ATPase, partial [Lentinula raphanica]
MNHPWTSTPEEILAHFNVEPSRGLSSAQAAKHAEIYGKNELPEDPATPLWELILEQFKDQLVLILLASAVISFVLALFEDSEGSSVWTAFVEPSVILLILIANATVGVIQESNAEKAIDALKEYSPDEAKVIRSSQISRIHATELVPGDIISVAVGDKVPADCRVISVSSSSFRVDQAILTGESTSVNKSIEVVPDVKAVKQDMTNMLFSASTPNPSILRSNDGTTVVNGTATAVVVFTGEKTAMGDIHKSITSQISEKTPLKRKLDDFGDMLAKVITVICILVWLVNIRHFWDPSHHGVLKGAIYYFKIAVALAVAAIPEGLAAVITACLALGTQKMAKKNAIVRNLPSVETLGCTNVICSDKTGTLTTNQMSVSRFVVVDGSGALRQYRVEGTTFSPYGEILTEDGKPAGAELQSDAIHRLAEIGAICNDSKIVYHSDKDSYTNVGEPTEAAIKVLVEKIGCRDTEIMKSLPSLSHSVRASAVNEYFERSIKRLLTFEFSRDRKMMSVLVRYNGSGSLFVKGAPESVLERCTSILVDGKTIPLTPDIKESLLQTTVTYGGQGLRNLALAYRDVQDTDASHYQSESTRDYARFEQDLTFVSIVGMLDPPRPEVRHAVANCKAAGIRVLCITGDNKRTAETICRQIGIFDEDEDLSGKSYTGRELDELSHEEKIAAVQRASLFSRTEPGHKSQLVDLLQGLGLVVAMTGDGVNDAPALKKADIGVAMGSGTDVAKLAADMVLADSNFATIEGAVEEGRLIYNNTKQFIRYLISSNIGEVVSIFLTVLLGMPEALIPVQLLWVNLVTDSLPATALGFNPPDHSIMRVPPRDSREPLVGSWLFFRYMVVGVYVGCATVFGYAWWFMFYEGGPQISFYQLTHFHQCATKFPEIGCQMFTNDMAQRATTISLSILVTVEMFNAMNSLSENESLLRLPLWKNPFLVGAIALSMALHFMILYTPFFTTLFAITPLNWVEWKAVLYFSAPVIVIDEILKFITASYIDPPSKVKVE